MDWLAAVLTLAPRSALFTLVLSCRAGEDMSMCIKLKEALVAGGGQQV